MERYAAISVSMGSITRCSVTSRRAAPPTGMTEADVQPCRLALLELEIER